MSWKEIRNVNKDYLKRNKKAINNAYKRETTFLRNAADWLNNLFAIHTNIHWLVPLLIIVVLLAVSGE